MATDRKKRFARGKISSSAGRTYLRQRGINIRSAISRGVREVYLQYRGFKILALEIPFFDESGVPILDAKGEIYCLKRLFPAVTKGPKPSDTKDWPKFLMPKDTPSQIYIDPLVRHQKQMPQNTELEIYISESPTRVMAAADNQLPGLWLSMVGVHNFLDTMDSELFARQLKPLLRRICCVDRSVFLCFDHDAQHNIHVQTGLHRLAGELFRLGAQVGEVIVPRITYQSTKSEKETENEGKDKSGIDDHIAKWISEGKTPREEFAKWTRRDTWGNATLRRVNRSYFIDLSAQDRPVGQFIKEVDGIRTIVYQSTKTFRDKLMHETVRHSKLARTRKGSLELRNVDEAVPEFWLRHAGRRQYKRVVTAPGETTPHDVLNLWEGWPIVPQKGDWSIIQDFIFEVICNADQTAFDFLLDWIANAFQDPAGNERPGVMVVMRGGEGTGKGTMARLLAEFYGVHYKPLADAAHALGQYNDWLDLTLLAFFDELRWASNASGRDILYTMITEHTLTVEGKYKRQRRIRNRTRFLAASNRDWVAPAGPNARRFFITDVSEKYAQDSKYFSKIYAAIEDPSVLAAMLHELMARQVDVNAIRRPPKTTALYENIYKSLPKMDKAWCKLLQETPWTRIGPTSDPWAKGGIRRGELVANFNGILDPSTFRNVVDVHDVGMFLRKYAPLNRQNKVRSKRNPDGSRSWILGSRDDCIELLCKRTGLPKDFFEFSE